MSVSRHVEMASCLKEVLVIYYVDDASESFESIVRSVCEGLTIASSEESACSAAHELRLKVYSSLWLCASEVIHALDKAVVRMLVAQGSIAALPVRMSFTGR